MARILISSIEVSGIGRKGIGPFQGSYLQEPAFRSYLEPADPKFNGKFVMLYEIQSSNDYDNVTFEGRWQNIFSGTTRTNVNNTDFKTFPSPISELWFRAILDIVQFPAQSGVKAIMEIWANQENFESVVGIPPELSIPSEETDDVIDLEKPGRQNKGVGAKGKDD
ncbi:MAG: hypothetical protein ACXADW_08640 [Candidatus Hodarchaeales archaeon]|jgi:hypothetical protein